MADDAQTQILKLQQTQSALEATLASLRSYIDETMKPLTSIVDTRINTETTGNQRVIFEAANARYTTAGVSTAAGTPRYETGFFSNGIYIGGGNTNADDATLTRASTAYLSDGTAVGSGEARYETGTYTSALLIEEGTANLVNTNAGATADFSAATGWTAMGSGSSISGGIATLQSPDGVTVSGYQCTLTDLADDTDHSFLIRARYKDGTGTAGNLALDLYAGGYDNAEQELAITTAQLTTSMQNFTKNGFDSQTAPASVALRIFTFSTRPIEVEFVQLEQKAYATTFHASTRVADVVTVPTVGVFVKSNWAVDLTVNFNVAPTSRATNVTLWHTIIDANNMYYINVRKADGKIFGVVVSGGTSKTVVSTVATTTGTDYRITFSGDGTNMRLCVNGSQQGSDTAYTEPVGTLPTNMYVGCNSSSAEQVDGTIDELRFGQYRTAAEHTAQYGAVLASDNKTSYLLTFDSTLAPAYAGSGVLSLAETLMIPNHLLSASEGALRLRFKLLRSPGIGSAQYLFDGGGATNYNLVVYVSTAGKLVVVYGDGSAEYTITGTTTIAVNTWYGLSLRWGDGGVVASLNTAQECVKNVPEASFTFGSYAYLGSKQDGTLQPDGIFDELLIENRETTDATAYAGYNSTSALTADAYTLLLMHFNDSLASNVLNGDISKTTGTLIIAQAGSSNNTTRADIIVPSGYTSAQKVIDVAVNDNLPSSGGSISLAEGTYTVDASLAITSKDNITIKGQGANTVLKLKDGSTFFDVFKFTSCDKLTISDLTIDGNKDNVTSDTFPSWYYILWFVTCNTLTLKNLTLINMPAGFDIAIAGCTDVTIDNVNIDYGGMGLAIVGSTTNNVNATNLIVKNCTNTGCYIAAVNAIKMSNIHVETCANGYFINADSLYGQYANCTALSNTEHGFYLYNNASSNTFTNCASRLNGTSADDTYANFFLDTNCDNNVFNGCVAKHGGGAVQTKYGMRINSSDCNTNKVKNCDLVDSGKTANYSNAGTGTVAANNDT